MTIQEVRNLLGKLINEAYEEGATERGDQLQLVAGAVAIYAQRDFEAEAQRAREKRSYEQYRISRRTDGDD